MKNIILKFADELTSGTIATRRDVHHYPESAWMEFRTSAKIAERLLELGYEIHLGEEILDISQRQAVPGDKELEVCWQRAKEEGADIKFLTAMKGGLTGVVGILKGRKPGPTVALRFDIDANEHRESQDKTHRPCKVGFASCHPGICHSCGHDAHVAIGLAVAEVLGKIQDRLKGTVKIIFQPAEEGLRGARPMVAKGIVNDVDYLMSVHIGLKAKRTGMLVANSTGFLANTKLQAVFTGKSAHAGFEPEEGRNALLAAAVAAINLHAVSRHSAGASRINVGFLQSGNSYNIVPDNAVLKLETRGITSEINAFIESRAQEVLRGAAQMYGIQLDIKAMGGAPSGEGDQELAVLIKKTANFIQGYTKVVDSLEFGASEDYTLMMQRVQERGGKAVHVMLGSDLTGGHHTPNFDIDERSLTLGVKLLSIATAELLTK